MARSALDKSPCIEARSRYTQSHSALMQGLCLSGLKSRQTNITITGEREREREGRERERAKKRVLPITRPFMRVTNEGRREASLRIDSAKEGRDFFNVLVPLRAGNEINPICSRPNKKERGGEGEKRRQGLFFVRDTQKLCSNERFCIT